MAILLENKEGKKIYLGIVNDKEIKKADKLNEYLCKKIPKIETSLLKNHERGSIGYWYGFGKKLRKIVDEFKISNDDRPYLWRAIENLSATEVSIRKNRSAKRLNYEYFFRIAEYSMEHIKRMNWSEWVTFLDSITLRREPRTLTWLLNKLKIKDINRKLFRTLVMGLNASLKGKDSTMYTYEQLEQRFEYVWEATEYLLKNEPKVKKRNIKNLKSDRQKKIEKKKRKKITKLRQMYFVEFFSVLKENKDLDVDGILARSFNRIYVKEEING